MDNFYVYQHKKADTNEIFYVGKGKDKRFVESKSRNPHWHNVVNKYGFDSEIIVKDVDEEFSFLVEMEAIDVYRRRGINLVNKTDGGEGTSGFSHPHTEDHKQWLKGNTFGASSWGLTFKGKTHSDETKARWSEIRKNNTNKTGKKISEEGKKNISAARMGKPILAKRILSDEQVREIKRLLPNQSIASIARQFSVGESTIRRVRDGERYGDIN